MADHVPLAGSLKITRISSFCEAPMPALKLDYPLKRINAGFGFLMSDAVHTASFLPQFVTTVKVAHNTRKRSTQQVNESISNTVTSLYVQSCKRY